MKTIVPEGYKKTKAGVIPNDWQFITLSDISSKITDGTHKTPLYQTNGVIFVSAKNIINGQLNFNDVKYISIEEHKLLVKRCNPQAGDILLTKSGSLGDSTVIEAVNFEFSIFESLALIKLKKDVNSYYINHFINSEYSKKHFHSITSGLAVKHLHLIDLRKTKIPLPSFKEQEKIAEILTTWDNTITKQTELIEAKNLQKKALVQKLLSGKVRFDGFDDAWKKVHLSQVLKERKTYSEKGLEFEHISLTKEGVVPKTERYERDQLVKDENKKYKITKLNDICYNPANLKFGVICKNTYGDGIFSPIYVTFEGKKEFDINFLGHFLTWNDFIMKVRRFEEGTVYERMAVNPKDFLSFKTKLPSLLEQQKIAEVLSLADDEINYLKKELEELKLQKKALMQKLLTGQVRVKI